MYLLFRWIQLNCKTFQHTSWLCIRTEALYLCLLCGDCSLSLFDHFWHFMHGRFQFFLIPINHHRTEGYLKLRCQDSHITMTLELICISIYIGIYSVSEFIQYRFVLCSRNSNSQILITLAYSRCLPQLHITILIFYIQILYLIDVRMWMPSLWFRRFVLFCPCHLNCIGRLCGFGDNVLIDISWF